MAIKKGQILFILAMILTTCYLVANVMAIKVIHIFGVSIFDAGTIVFPLTYLMGNTITEIWGYKTTRFILFTALGCEVLFCLCAFLGIFIPSPTETETIANAYAVIFGFEARIMLASFTAFAIGELLNAKVLQRIKEKQFSGEGKHPLWIRTVTSSVIAYCIDTTIFVCIAFIGVVPYDQVLSMIGLQIIAKIVCELVINTPLVYLLVHFIHKHAV